MRGFGGASDGDDAAGDGAAGGGAAGGPSAASAEPAQIRIERATRNLRSQLTMPRPNRQRSARQAANRALKKSLQHPACFSARVRGARAPCQGRVTHCQRRGGRLRARALRIASWNVNSIRARIDHVHRFLREAAPDVLCLQETKVTDADFPTDTFARAGYETHRSGEKSYNGVAIVSRHPVSDVRVGFVDGSPNDDRRLIAGTIGGLRVLSAYIPNGKSLDSPAYEEKLSWLERLTVTLSADGVPERPLALCGDFNVARDDRDVFDPVRWRGQLHCTPREREALARLIDLGLCDSFREKHTEAGRYSWWDYRAGSFARDRGLRIDYVWLSSVLQPRLLEAAIDRSPRSWDKPSDHTPVLVDLDWPL